MPRRFEVASQREKCPKRLWEAGLRAFSAILQVLKMAHCAERKHEKTYGTLSPVDHLTHAEDDPMIAGTPVRLFVLSEDSAHISSHALLSDAATNDTQDSASVGYA